MNFPKTMTALAAATLVLLPACSESADEEDVAVEETTHDTLATLVGDDDNLSTLSDLLGDAGLQDVFDGSVPYTLFAPTDEAFAAFDLPMEGDDLRAARVAVVREHIVPGYLTLEDIGAAIESAGGSVEMQTMGSGTLTFTQGEDGLVITSADGAEARVNGTVTSGENGTLFPIDTVLKSSAAAE